ncbi:MAG: YkvA family protein [Candidatus Promineifilaceae bacterium]
MSDNERTNQNEEAMNALDTTMSPNVRDTGFWKSLWYQIRLVWYLVRDPEVPFYVKLIPVAALFYVLIPTDFIPDIFPVMGQLDDLTALLVGGKVFIEMSPQHVVQKYLAMLRQHRGVDSSEDMVDGAVSEDGTSSLEETIIIDGEYFAIDDELEEE